MHATRTASGVVDRCGRWSYCWFPTIIGAASLVAGQRCGSVWKNETMHYPRRNSKIKRARKQGFRTRMRTVGGRKIINRKRRKGVYKISVC